MGDGVTDKGETSDRLSVPGFASVLLNGRVSMQQDGWTIDQMIPHCCITDPSVCDLNEAFCRLFKMDGVPYPFAKRNKEKSECWGLFQLPLDVKWEVGLECARNLAVTLIALCEKPSDLLKTRPTGNKMANEYLDCFSHTAMRLNASPQSKVWDFGGYWISH